MDLITCLWFNGNAREAATFYTSIFPNSHLADNWLAPTDTPGNAQGDEVVVNFTIFGKPFIGLNGGPQFPHTQAISFQIPCSDQAEIDKYWELLTADGGKESQCGWLKDRFGLSWQIVPDGVMQLTMNPDPAVARRAMAAMMTMRKIDVAAIEAARRG